MSINGVIVPREPGIEDESLAQLMYGERRMGGETQSYSSRSGITEVPEAYQPKSTNPSFEVAVIEVPKDMAQITLASPSPDLLRKYIGKNAVHFCAHPQALKTADEIHVNELLKMKFLKPLTVMASASSRSVSVLDTSQGRHAIKCHLPVKISTFTRDLRPASIRNAVAVSKILGETDIPHLPESIGVALPGNSGKRGWGFIVRELTPRPTLPGHRIMVPCFALYGIDTNRPHEQPLLAKLIKRDKANPLHYCLEHVMFPIIDDFAKALNEQGVLLEAHGQNSLIEFNASMKPQRIVHRDLNEYVDGQRRRELGLSMEGISDHHIYDKPTEEEPFGSVPSLIYDTSIGCCHFDPLSKMMEKQFGVPIEKLQRECQARFQRKIPDSGRTFNNTLYTYGYKVPTPKNVYPLIPWANHTAGPVWRPSIPKSFALTAVRGIMTAAKLIR